mmetsp:Transcript_158212/g.295129  ORF Transcript_158212/g.295129 Transcript_158212/m.295129 type:complete len:153 (-) Transcript_158212:28-486(-)
MDIPLCRLLQFCLMTLLGALAGVDGYDSNFPECVELTKAMPWFDQTHYKWTTGMVFEQRSAITRNSGDAQVYWTSSQTDRCLYPAGDRLRTTSMSRCQQGGLDGAGFHYIPKSSWRGSACSKGTGSSKKRKTSSATTTTTTTEDEDDSIYEF